MDILLRYFEEAVLPEERILSNVIKKAGGVEKALQESSALRTLLEHEQRLDPSQPLTSNAAGGPSMHLPSSRIYASTTDRIRVTTRSSATHQGLDYYSRSADKNRRAGRRAAASNSRRSAGGPATHRGTYYGYNTYSRPPQNKESPIFAPFIPGMHALCPASYSESYRRNLSSQEQKGTPRARGKPK